jgi:rubrerythrin
MKDFSEFQSSDEMIPAEYDEYLDWKDVVDPDFEILQNSLPDIPETVGNITFCPTCGAEVLDIELDHNDGSCPCCDTPLDEDIPF